MILDLVMAPSREIIPATERDIELINRVKVGDLLPVELKRVRNGNHHRKMMALIQFVASNHPGVPDHSTGRIVPWAGVDSVITWLKIRTQHFRAAKVIGEKVYLELRSISYRELDQAEFEAWAKQATELIFSELFPDLADRQRIEQEIERWISWS